MSAAAVSLNQQNSNPIFAFGHEIVQGTRTVIKGASQIQGDVTSLARAIRIVGYLFALIAPGAQPKLRSVINLTDGFVDAAQTVGSVHDLTDKTKPEDVPVLKKSADIAFIAAGAASIVQFLDHVNIIELPIVSSSTGSVGILAKVTKDVLSNAASVVLAGAFTLLAINAGVKLVNSIKEINAAKESKDNGLEIARLKRNQAILDLAFCVSEVAFFVLGIFSVLPPIALVIMGIASAGLGIATFLYSQHREAKVEELTKKI